MKNLFNKIKTFKKEKKILFWIIAIPSSLLILCLLFVLSAVITAFVSIFSESSFALKSPTTTEWSTTNPSEPVIFECINIQEITLNGKSLSKNAIDTLCSSAGYKLSLEDGENVFVFAGSKTGGDTINEVTLKITFDAEAYEQLVEEKQAELAKQKEEAEKAQQEAEAEKLKAWKATYSTVKNEYIADAYEKSENMIDTFSNGTSLYETRNLANKYKDYFLFTCNKNLEEELSSPPSFVDTEDIKNLNSYYSDFCMNNEFLARQVVEYTEAETTTKQYEALDMITYYRNLVDAARIGIEANLAILDEAVK